VDVQAAVTTIRGLKPPVAVTLNPGFGPGFTLPAPGGVGPRFGVGNDDMRFS
jgi:hypothetical protein